MSLKREERQNTRRTESKGAKQWWWKIILPVALAAFFLATGQWGLNLAGGQVAALAAGRQVTDKQAGETFAVSSVISTTFIPLVTMDYDYYPKMLTGSFSPAANYTCDGAVNPSNAICTRFDVSCPGISGNMRTYLRATDPMTATLKGTMVFFTGENGGRWWGDINWTHNPSILDHMRWAGFRTVEVKWPGSVTNTWFYAPAGSLAGMAKLGCRPATVIQWVYDNLHTDKSLPYCASGHSNGGSQLGLTLVYYGMGEILDAAVFESGPNYTRIDKSCLCDDPAFINICWKGATDPGIIDGSYGERSGLQPCSKKDVSFRSAFIFDSIINDFWRYRYLTTTVSFVFGGADTSQTALQARLYAQRLISLSPTNVFSTTVPGGDHYVTWTEPGAQVMEDTLKNTCTMP